MGERVATIMKYDVELSRLIKKEEIAQGIFDFTVKCPSLAKKAQAGQFAHLAVPGKTLRRPISICDAVGDSLRLVFQVRGQGTEKLAQAKVGDDIDVLAPLGHGFTIPPRGTVAFIGGGIGVPPMLYSGKQAEKAIAILGFRDKAGVILAKDFEEACSQVIVTTDDGSFGLHGFVTDALRTVIDKVDLVCACGPTPMLKAVAAMAREHNTPCQVSMEERMGCGVGACLVCACKTKKDNKEGYSHVCKNGPVFNAEEVVW